MQPYVESTIGASFMSKLILVDGSPIKFQVKYPQTRFMAAPFKVASSVCSDRDVVGKY